MGGRYPHCHRRRQIHGLVSRGGRRQHNVGRDKNFFVDTVVSLSAKLFGKTLMLEPVFDDSFVVEFTEKYAKSVSDGLEENAYTVENDRIVFINGKPGYSIDSEKANEQIKKALTSKENERVVLERVMRDPQPLDIEKIYEDVCTPPVNAEYKIIDGKGYLVEAKNGYSFDKAAMKAFLEENKTNTEKYEFVLEVVQPEQKEADTSGLFTDTLATYTSKITDSNADRLSNVKLAAQKINGIVMNPGDSFSYLSYVQPITIAAGYKVANVYANGKVEQDVGGGVCQVSSALYSAVLYADLEVTKRYAHSLTVAYVPLGMDATVASGEIDFRFINNTDAPLMIKTNFTKSGITVTLLGEKKDEDLKIEIENTTVQTLYPEEEITEDETLPKGERVVDYAGKNGYVVQTYKKYFRDGVLEKREYVGKSTYKCINKSIRVGTAPVVETSAPVQETPYDTAGETGTEQSEAPAVTEPTQPTEPTQQAPDSSEMPQVQPGEQEAPSAGEAEQPQID